MLAVLLSALTLITSAGTLPAPAAEPEVPIINLAWDFDLHGGALLAAASKGKDFKDSGYYLEPVVEKQQYSLFKGDKKIALINTIVTKGSSETAVLMGQKRIDCCVNSSTGMMCTKDQGTDVQILCPIHVDGICLVFPAKSKVYGWKAVEKAIKSSKAPFRIGFHSPTSAPRVLIQAALTRAGIKVSLDPNDKNAELVFTTTPTKKWLEGEALYVEMLNQLGIFEGEMKGKSFKDVKEELFNFQFISE